MKLLIKDEILNEIEDMSLRMLRLVNINIDELLENNNILEITDKKNYSCSCRSCRNVGGFKPCPMTAKYVVMPKSYPDLDYIETDKYNCMIYLQDGSDVDYEYSNIGIGDNLLESIKDFLKI